LNAPADGEQSRAPMIDPLDTTLARTRAHLLALRHEAGHWDGELSSSALSTATAIVALHAVAPDLHAAAIKAGAAWLVQHQNADGGWGDTTLSKSNLSTTLLAWSALHRVAPETTAARSRAETWIRARTGSLEPADLARAVVARYGKDKTFSVPILMLCAIGGTLGESPWRQVLPLPFELAALPRAWFGAIGLPVVSYALPALIAIGHARFQHAPPAAWNPLRWLRAALWPRISPMLLALQPSSGGYLEATPLTSFVTMALATAGEKHHPCVPAACAFLLRSMRADGSWPIDTNLATWGTTLAVKALGEIEPATADWLLGQQYRTVHPFTGAGPGGWAWTDLPGGVPDADDTPGALIALRKCESRQSPQSVITPGIAWLLNLQNRDGGMPTFCRGWGALPFDRSTPELTAHALLAWHLWRDELAAPLRLRIAAATGRALAYLRRVRRANGSWIPLWFGNEHARDEENPVYGTAQVTAFLSLHPGLATEAAELIRSGAAFLLATQQQDGGWGGDAGSPASIEETAVATHALALQADPGAQATALRGANWLIAATQGGTVFPASAIGLYFARLWYHEKLYPVVFTLQALHAVRMLA
jgi:squalene-hopene/tetraprenyl-beta-curcumene cyclase